MEEFTNREIVRRLEVMAFRNRVRRTMDVRTQCFERIAPTRKLTLPRRPARHALDVLRRADEKRHLLGSQEYRR